MPQHRIHASGAARQAAYRARCKTQRLDEMAHKGLPPLSALPSMPSSARWKAAIAQAHQLLASVQDEMQAYYDARSELWQEGARAEEFIEHQAAVEEILELTAQLHNDC